MTWAQTGGPGGQLPTAGTALGMGLAILAAMGGAFGALNLAWGIRLAGELRGRTGRETREVELRAFGAIIAMGLTNLVGAPVNLGLAAALG